jgi:hypothetical protein
MEKKRVANNISKYIPRSKVGLKGELKEKKDADVSARRGFVVASDGYFVWSSAKKSEL